MNQNKKDQGTMWTMLGESFFCLIKAFLSKQTNLKNTQRNLNPTGKSKITVLANIWH